MASYNLAKFQADLTRIAAAKPPASATKVIALARPQYRFWTMTSARMVGMVGRPLQEHEELEQMRCALHLVVVMICHNCKPCPSGAPPSITALGQWVSLVGSSLLNVFSDYVTEEPMRACIAEIPDSTKILLRDLSDYLFAAKAGRISLSDTNGLMGTEEKARVVINTIADALGFPGMEKDASFSASYFAHLTNPQSAANYVAILVFICSHTPGRGNQSSAVNYKSIMEARPKNIQDKFMEGQARADLTGPLRMTRDAVDWVGQAWEKDGAFRWGFYAPLCGIQGSLTDIMTGPVRTSLHLSEDAYFTSMKVSAEFLLTYQWVVQIPELSSAIRCLLQGPDLLEKYEPHLRPHAKVLDRDMCSAYNSVVLQPLAALAVHVLKKEAATLAGYRIQPPAPIILAKFEQMLEAQHPSGAVAGGSGSSP